MVQRPHALTSGRDEDKSLAEKASSSDAGAKRSTSSSFGNMSGTPVLTLYGGAPQPKQLFSSLQQSTRKLSRLPGLPETTIESKDPIREHSLPNGITVTKVVPVHSTGSTNEKRKIPTIGELFAPPTNLPPLNPPKQSRHTATRSSSVRWFHASEPLSSGRPHRRDSYPLQPLSAGQWLAYNATSTSNQLSSPGVKRKQRDRTLSFGEAQPTTPQEMAVAHNQAKEDALFRSAYSSFAPDRDNTAALVSDHIKNRVWWKRFGENKLQDSLELTPSAVEEETLEVNGVSASTEIVDDEFKGIEESWTPEDLPSELKESMKHNMEPPERTTEVDEILQEISELLETLNSYQRARNLSLTNTGRAIGTSQHTALCGSPTNPSSAEFDIYATLKSQLTVMVSSLPPYAVAKLDGEKLGVLNISTKIRVEDKNHAGTMTEDESSAKSKQMVTSPAAPYSSRPVNASSSVPSRSNSYIHPISTPVQQTQRSGHTAVPRSANPSSAYLPNQQYSSRPASSNHHFSGSTYPISTYSSFGAQNSLPTTSERYSYSAAQQYNQRSAQSSQYQNGYRPYPLQNGASYSRQHTTPQVGPSTLSAQTPAPQTQRPSQPGYQQRAMNSQTFSYGPVSSAADALPIKANAAQSPQQQRATAASQIQTPNQQRTPLYHQHSTQYAALNSTVRQANGTVTTPSSSQSAYMTADEQSALMNRQKAQLADQQKSSSRPGSNTPQPINGSYNGQQNGTPVMQPNGLTTGQGQ